MSAVDRSQGLPSALLSMTADPTSLADLHELLGEFCHLFRNRLNCFRLSIYLGRRAAGEAEASVWDRLESRYRTVEQTIERLQWICKPIRLEPVEVDFGKFMKEAELEWVMRGAGTTLPRVEPRGPGAPLICRFDPSLLLHGLNAVLAWRGELLPSDSVIRVSWRERQGRIELDWSESSVDDSASTLLEASSPASLALPLLSRIVSAHGGGVSVAGAGSGTSWSLRCQWPTSGLPPHSSEKELSPCS